MIQKIGIIGSGKMGQDIFNYLSDFKYHINWFIRDSAKREKLEKSYHRKLSRQVKHQIITSEQFAQKSAHVITDQLNHLSGCDLIIETIREDMETKHHTFATLKTIIRPQAIVVSNSSSIIPSKLSLFFPVAGMHFFYPVALKNIVELVLPEDFYPEKVSLLEHFLKSIRKTYFIQDEQNAFLLNRFLLSLQLKAFLFSVDQNVPLTAIDQVSQNLLPDFGLFGMMDHVGLSTMYYSIQNYATMEKEPGIFQPLLNRLKEKILHQQPMVDNHKISDIGNSKRDEILGFLSQESRQIFHHLFIHSPGQQKNYRIAIHEFCGLEL